MIEVQNLRKDYIVYEQNNSGGLLNSIKGAFQRRKKIVTALKDVSFRIEPGEIVGYIGTNGAGKSTTIKILTGILLPTSGKVLVNDRDPFKYRKRNVKNIGVIFGQRSQLWWDLPVADSYELLYRIYGISRQDYRQNLDYLVDVLEVHDFIHTPVRMLSLGQRMRCEILAALLHNPSLVFLDEPTIGLDIFVKDKIRHMIRQINRERKTTFLVTSHDMGDITETCNRLLILSRGMIDFDGELSKFQKMNTTIKMISFEVKEKVPLLDGLHPLVEDITVEDHRVKLSYDADKVPLAQLTMKVMAQNEVLDMHVQEASIADILKRKYGEQQHAN